MGNASMLPEPQKQIQILDKGILKLYFLEEEIKGYSKDLQFALLGKFSFGYPEMKEIVKTFRSFNLKGVFTIGVLNSNKLEIIFFKILFVG